MRQIAVLTMMLALVAAPSFAKVHKDTYPMACSALWPAVKDTLRNSGKYGILGLVDSEMTATYSMGMGSLGQKRSNSVNLNAAGDNSCDMVVSSGYSGLGNNDAGDFKKRVDASLAKMKEQPAPPAKPEGDKK